MTVGPVAETLDGPCSAGVLRGSGGIAMAGATGSGATSRGSRAGFEARLRPLGPRGEGWIGIQMLFEIGALVLAVLTGPVVSGPARVVIAIPGFLLLVGGIGLFAWGASHLDASFSIWVDPRPGGRLVTSGPYRWARHPVCTGQVLIVAGWSLVAASIVGLLMVPVVAVYLDRFKLAREEQTLLGRYPEYPAYMAAVPHRMWPARPRDAETGTGG
jgi:protein-S-isoprenylcysteine O-methyltransferase Ste14